MTLITNHHLVGKLRMHGALTPSDIYINWTQNKRRERGKPTNTVADYTPLSSTVTKEVLKICLSWALCIFLPNLHTHILHYYSG
jgi:hypothetical protein